MNTCPVLEYISTPCIGSLLSAVPSLKVVYIFTSVITHILHVFPYLSTADIFTAFLVYALDWISAEIDIIERLIGHVLAGGGAQCDEMRNHYANDNHGAGSIISHSRIELLLTCPC